MSWSWFISALIALIGGAIVVELWLRRGTRPPLSSHAVNQRRWDDPNRPDRDKPFHVIEAETGVGRQGLSGNRQYKVAKDPQEQARMLMPDHARNRTEDNSND